MLLSTMDTKQNTDASILITTSVHAIEINFPCIITFPDLVCLYVYCSTARFLLKNQLKPSLVIEFNRSLQFTVSLCAYYYVN